MPTDAGHKTFLRNKKLLELLQQTLKYLNLIVLVKCINWRGVKQEVFEVVESTNERPEIVTVEVGKE